MLLGICHLYKSVLQTLCSWASELFSVGLQSLLGLEFEVHLGITC